VTIGQLPSLFRVVPLQSISLKPYKQYLKTAADKDGDEKQRLDDG
jgi:hypothetical protein